MGLLPALVAGLALWLDRRGPWVTLARSLALGSAVVVLVTELLPAATDALGPGALIVAALGFGLPAVLERFTRREGGVQLVAIGVLVHQGFDGVQVGALVEPLGLAVALAIALHGLPLVAVTLMALVGHMGRRPASLFWVAVLAATAAGVLGGGALPTAWFGTWEPWLQAAMAGLLLHVVAHDAVRSPRARWTERAADLAGLLAGGAIALALLELGHEHSSTHTGHAHLDFVAALIELGLETAPALLLGLGAAAVLHATGWSWPQRWPAWPPLRGALLGVPLPVSATTRIPVASQLSASTAPALVVAFLIAVPSLGPDTLTLSVRFLGWPMTALRIGGTLLVAIGAGTAVHWALARSGGSARLLPSSPGGSWTTRVLQAGDELLLHTGPTLAAGVVMASCLEAFVHGQSLTWATSTGLDLPLLTLGSVPTTVGAAAATPLAGVLWSKGLASGAVLAALLVGPALDVHTLTLLSRTYGARAAAATAVAVLCIAWGIGAVVTPLLGSGPPMQVSDAVDHGHGWATYGAAALLFVVVAASLARHGSAAWLTLLVGGHSHTHSHGHADDHHGHSDSHDHEHHTPHEAGVTVVQDPHVGVR